MKNCIPNTLNVAESQGVCSEMCLGLSDSTTLHEEELNIGWIQKEIQLKTDFISNFKEYGTVHLKGGMSPEW